MIEAHTNTVLKPVLIREKIKLKYPFVYDARYKLSSAPRAGSLDDTIIYEKKSMIYYYPSITTITLRKDN